MSAPNSDKNNFAKYLQIQIYLKLLSEFNDLLSLSRNMLCKLKTVSNESIIVFLRNCV